MKRLLRILVTLFADVGMICVIAAWFALWIIIFQHASQITPEDCTDVLTVVRLLVFGI